jgi:2'-hydroxyisoflavone reductase
VASILVIGGTGFLGPHLCRAAGTAGHGVTVFHRGHSALSPEFAWVDEVLGDRLESADLARLAEREWDAVIDTSCYFPRAARISLAALEGRFRSYLLVSSISAYAETDQPFVREDAPLRTLADESVEEVTGETYGGLKALCEAEVMATIPDRGLVVRPGLVAGPGDHTDRFTYWCRRFSEPGEVLAPGPAGHHLQYMDVRDMTRWMIEMAVAGHTGVFNATGPAGPLAWEEFLGVCAEVGGAGATPVWVDEMFLMAEGVAPWSELPLWVPPSTGQITADNAAAVKAGLRHRPVRETLADTLTWARDRPPWGLEGRPGLSAEREQELLRKWSRVPRPGES